MNQIKQHQFERQKLMEAVRQHGEMMGFKRREEGRAQNKENRAQQSFDQKNAIMQELANWFQNKGGNQNQSMGGNTARPAAPNVAASGMPANEQATNNRDVDPARYALFSGSPKPNASGAASTAYLNSIAKSSLGLS